MVTAAVAAPLGFAVRPVSIAVSGAAPQVPWATVAGPWVLAVLVALAAWGTRRALPPPDADGRPPRPRTLQPHQAVNRLVLGKAAAVVGMAVAGGYAGFALAAVTGVVRQLDGERAVHSLVAALGGVLLTVGGLLLERACRTPTDDEGDLA